MAQSTVSMKLLIDTKGKRVVFAEAGKECVDFLFQLLSLPVATIIRLLQPQGMPGSLPNLYQSLENLEDTYIQPYKKKDTFLQPVVPFSSSSIPLLALSPDEEQVGRRFYRCGNCSTQYRISDDKRAVCPSCFRQMTTSVTYVAPYAVQEAPGLVKGVVTYMVMDNLEVKPMSTISAITLLNKFQVEDVGVLLEKVVNLGMDEICFVPSALKLLKASLQTQEVLTHVFC